jgi:hypothetical protein
VDGPSAVSRPLLRAPISASGVLARSVIVVVQQGLEHFVGESGTADTARNGLPGHLCARWQGRNDAGRVREHTRPNAGKRASRLTHISHQSRYCSARPWRLCHGASRNAPSSKLVASQPVKPHCEASLGHIKQAVRSFPSPSSLSDRRSRCSAA